MVRIARLVAVAGLAAGVGMATAQPGGTRSATPPETRANPVTPMRTRIGESTAGAPIEVITLAALGPDAHGRSADERPAVLIVAGLQGHHTVGIATAEAVIERLAADHADLLATHTVYVIPNANPDGSRWIEGAPQIESGRIPQSGDADRDGRMDEDPAEDLNGDGVVTQMRVRAPAAHWGLRASLIPDPDNPRLMRDAKPEEGEVGEWAILQEGIDNDGDGRFNEDGGGGSSGGVDLGMNFPTHYPEHEDGAGRYPLSSPEALAIVRWVQGRSNIVAAVVYDPHDSIVTIPVTGQFGPEGDVPRGIEEGDKPYYQRVSDAFKEATRMAGAPTGRTAGSLASWAYGDFGVWTFSTPVWVRPDQIKAEGEGEGGDKPEAGGEAEPDKAAQREALIAEGYPPRIADFLVASPAERQAMMAEIEALPEAERQARLAEVMSLTPEQQRRVMEAAGIRGGRVPIGGPPGSHQHDHGEGGHGLFELFFLAPIELSPAGLGIGGPPGGVMSTGTWMEALATRAIAQPGGGRRFGGGQPGGGAPAGGRPGGGGAASGGDDAKWLAYSDEQRGGEGFIEWTAFEHPQLGSVEIGGFVPGFRVNPPEEELDRLADEQTAFIAALIPMLPDVSLDLVEAEHVGGGLWRVRARVSNPGFLPTASAIGLKARRVSPIVVQVSTEPEMVLTGQRVRRFDSLEGSGAVREAEWLIQGEAGQGVTVEVRSDVFGTRRGTVTLGEREGGR